MQDRLIDAKELRSLVPYSPTHIRRLEAEGKFPRRVKLTPRRVFWWLSEVNAFSEGKWTPSFVRPTELQPM